MEVRDSLRAAFGTERLVAWAVAAVTLGVVVTVVTATGGGLLAPPTAGFEGAYDASSQTVTLTHGGGDRLQHAAVTVTVVTGAHSTNLTWTSRDDGTIERGASLSIDDATIDADGDGNYFDAERTVGFALTEETTVTIRWTGRPFGAPSERTVPLDTYRVGGE